MANQTGVLIEIKAWLPTGKGLDAQWEALSLVRTAHESGDYAPLLAAASIEAVKTESKTRRMEVVAEPTPLSEPVVWPNIQTSGPITDAERAAMQATVEGRPVIDQPAPESNVGEAPIGQPSLVPDEPQPNPIRKGRKAA